MRWPFACALHDLAKRDDRVVLLMGDVGGGLLSTFAKDFPRRYFNLGTAEQSMIGIAAGLALQGLRPVVYSFTPFLLERAFEQIKIDVQSNHAPVLLVGWEDATQGITHAAVDSLATLRLFRGIKTVAPETEADVKAWFAQTNPDEWPAFVVLKEPKK